jgi:transposase
VFQEKIDAIEDAAQRLRRLDEQLRAVVPTWSMARVVDQAMRGASFLVAVIFAAEIGDVRRFDTPPQLMAFLGLVPGSVRPATRSAGRALRSPAIDAPAAPWSKRLGHTATPPGSARP